MGGQVLPSQIVEIKEFEISGSDDVEFIFDTPSSAGEGDCAICLVCYDSTYSGHQPIFVTDWFYLDDTDIKWGYVNNDSMVAVDGNIMIPPQGVISAHVIDGYANNFTYNIIGILLKR